MNPTPGRKRPNIVFVFADQWRAQAVGHAGDANVQTPNLDELAADSVRFTTAVAPCPVCSPYRASLLTGQNPLAHGVFVNDVHLDDQAVSIAKAFKAGGYDTGYVGKWHLDGRGRTRPVALAGRQGFDFWRVCECTHDYNQSVYYGDDERRRTWPGYDAFAQTETAADYIAGNGRDRDKPFLLMVSWGPPHDPYDTAPQRFKALYDPAALRLRPNVPGPAEERARRELAGYYAHCSALDECVARLRGAIRRPGIEDDTIFVFTSDHGDMLGSQGQFRKQRPWDESILVPLLMHGPGHLGPGGRTVAAPFSCTDIMPTLLSLCGLPIPRTVEGKDFKALLTGQTDQPPADAVLIACYHPFAQFAPPGGREYRGLRTERYTYVRDLAGPWLLYDNQADPFQTANLVNQAAHADLQSHLDAALSRMLCQQGDEFLPGGQYMRRWGYPMGPDNAVPFDP